jgi:hypothetical protein
MSAPYTARAMTNHHRRLLSALPLLALLGAAPVVAEPTATAPADAPTADAPNALQPLEDKVGFLQGKLEALEEQYAESKNDILTFKKLKFSGYIQARYTFLDAAIPESKFFVRRGRIKAEYQGSIARYMLQVDATGEGVSLKDAEASLTEPWSGKKLLTLTAGQTKVPFGYEVNQSSSEREFPERTGVVRAFINGERDRGVKLAFSYKFVRATLGLFDGNGIANTAGFNGKDSAGFLGKDNDTAKDFIGRVGVDFKWLALGVSGWKGTTKRWADDSKAVDMARFDRTRIGVDAQAYLDLLPLGGTAIKAELISGTTYQSSGGEVFGRTGLGWYALIVQNIFEHEQLAVRYDYWDPATGTSTKVDSKDPAKPASTNPVQTLGLIATHYFDEVFKISAVYELPMTLTTGTTDVAPRRNLFTLQFMGKF